MTPPLVTFIVATYLRADALQAALHSVCLQGHESWEAIVIGDCCGPETAAAVAAVRDCRIRYYNLPDRYGEQGGPNTAGLHLARGEYIVFLNHDDVLMPDHVSYVLERMGSSGATLFQSRFAVAQHVECNDTGQPHLVYSRLTHLNSGRSADWRYDSLEPASAWTISGEVARQVGAWRPSRALSRSPLRDWILRAARMGGRVEFGELVTGVRFGTHNVRSGLRYAAPSPELGTFVETLRHRSADAVRADIMKAVKQYAARPASPAPASRWQKFVPWVATLHRYTGVDVEPLIHFVRGRPNTSTLRWSLSARTGEAPPRIQSLGPFFADPERWRVL